MSRQESFLLKETLLNLFNQLDMLKKEVEKLGENLKEINNTNLEDLDYSEEDFL